MTRVLSRRLLFSAVRAVAGAAPRSRQRCVGSTLELAHRIFTRFAFIARLLARFGVFEASTENAHAALAHGHRVLVYPGGDHDSLTLWTRRCEIDFGGRLETAAHVPIVPVLTAGSHGTLLAR